MGKYFILNFLLTFVWLRFPLAMAKINVSVNVTEFLNHRQKRHLVFEGGGNIKLVMGPALPVPLGDPVDWRGLIAAYNLQGGTYTIQSTPLYPWDKWETIFSRSVRRMRARIHYPDKFVEDDSRLFVYTALEAFMNKLHGNGRDCLLRSICVNAQIDQHVGVFAEIYNIVLTPGNMLLEPAYKAAYDAGKSGIECNKLYGKCTVISNFLDQHMADF
ncbi:uncharacterized protein LOC119673024 [Teleopsis dalmanni]|uniref:uncharacterized protein LOC119673024 n=1 Tax=Teleopsis dalmanni TaxID=139649 RepID=UPI0018CD6484|nr:uncharacterized protein LOC119673024 [Teleopsis dalmanni]